MAFPRASMISDEYVMPEFSNERDLLNPLGIKDSGDWSQDGQSLTIDAVSVIISLSLNLINISQILGGKDSGFYVEVGADDGENYSNSLFFEVFRNWRGILIEPNQESFAKMKRLGRKEMVKKLLQILYVTKVVYM